MCSNCPLLPGSESLRSCAHGREKIEVQRSWEFMRRCAGSRAILNIYSLSYALLMRRKLLIFAELAHEREFHHQIVETGALKSVCKIMHHTNSEDVFQNAASIISLMCESDEGRETIRHSGGLLPLLKPLKTMSFWSNPGCTHAITEALYKTAISVLNCEVYRATKAVDMLLGKLYEGIGETLVFNILGFLSEMARLEQSRHFIRSSGVFPFIMDYMGHDNQYIRMKAAVATGRMGADKDSECCAKRYNR